jgi:hypothetical protein
MSLDKLINESSGEDKKMLILAKNQHRLVAQHQQEILQQLVIKFSLHSYQKRIATMTEVIDPFRSNMKIFT